MNRPNRFLIYLMVAVLGLLMAACSQSEGMEGPPGPAGPPGPEGPQGPAGEAGPAGESVTPLDLVYVGSETCAGCHQQAYEAYLQSGHPWILNPVENGQPPDYPFSEVPEPPAGYTWDEISYVVGGYRWKAHFLDSQGYLITGEEEETLTQYNLPNRVIFIDGEFVSYHPGEAELSYDCGSCHTTGFNPNGNQDDLPGISGTWAAAGVQCEACHGQGSLHVQNPRAVQMRVERDRQACESCHLSGPPADASEVFISHHDDYGGMFQGKHQVLDCITCHDPHSGDAQPALAADGPTARPQCTECHFNQAQFQKVGDHVRLGVECVTCHMPRAIENAWGDEDVFIADVRTHVVAITPYEFNLAGEEGSEGGGAVLSQIPLNLACRQCHVENRGVPLADEVLIENATNYHAEPQDVQ